MKTARPFREESDGPLEDNQATKADPSANASDGVDRAR